MAIELQYDSEEDVPEAHRELYTEVDGKWNLTGITGMKTQADVDRLTKSLEKERVESRRLKGKMEVWGDLDQEKVLAELDELKEARIRLDAGEGKVDEEKIETLVTARVATQVAPIQRKLDASEKLLGEQGEAIVGFESANTVRTITDAVRKAGVGAKIIDTAMEDALMLGERVFEITDEGMVLTRDKMGVTPGIDPVTWFSEMQEKRSHWWPKSTGGGAPGSDGGGGFSANPFSRDHWNLTEQGRAVVSDRGKADRMAKSAGTTIGGGKPTPKAS